MVVLDISQFFFNNIKKLSLIMKGCQPIKDYIFTEDY